MRPNPPPLRTAIIGTSRVGSFFEDRLAASPELIPSSHAACYAAHPRTELVAGCDVIPERLEAFGQRWGITALFSDYREMIDTVKPDVVSVCTAWGHTRDELFPEVACRGVGAGGSVRAIWGEKPFSTSMANANATIHAIESNGVTFQGTYPRRCTPRDHADRAQIDRGEIGDVISVTIVGAAGLVHNGTHDTDAMTFFAGDPEPAFALGHVEPEEIDGKGRPIQDARGNGYIVHKNGVRFFIEGLSFQGSTSFIISGTEGRIHTINDCKRIDLWRHPAEKSTRWMSHVPQEEVPIVKSPPLQQLEDLVDALDTGRQPICTARQAARFMEYGLALHSSHRRGGVRVNFPLEDQLLSIDAW
jgi:UDP-N-acetylglucosamine 3-dehydrogenase